MLQTFSAPMLNTEVGLWAKCTRIIRLWAGISLVAGRDITVRDDSTSEPVAIISESVAQREFPGHNPLGALIRVRRDTITTRMHVVGVTRDTKMSGLRDDRVPAVYAPVTQTGSWPFLGLAVRAIDHRPASGVAARLEWSCSAMSAVPVFG